MLLNTRPPSGKLFKDNGCSGHDHSRIHQCAMPARVRSRSPKFGLARASATCALQETLLDLPEPVTHTCHPIPCSDFEKGDVELQRLLDGLELPAELPVPQPCPDGLPELQLSPRERDFPVYVMLPLDTVWLADREGQKVSVIKREQALNVGLQMLKKAGVEGIMIDVWWGIVEHTGPKQYDFSAYQRLFATAAQAGLKIQAVMSFHAAGGNVGDTCKISLPKWISDIGMGNPDIFYTDKQGYRNKECLSLGCDSEPLFWGRTPVDIYRDFISAFADTFDDLAGSKLVEVTVGLGPAGELRYPAYPEGDGRWRFPGVGEFQCYDKYMLADLKQAADAVGRPEWGCEGPHDCGDYNSPAWDTAFFVSSGGSWDTEYGNFFLSWYSNLLLQHADRILAAASEALNKPGRAKRAAKVLKGKNDEVTYCFEPGCHLGAKLAGVHWWFKSRAHAAELTAGYYNTRERDGYAPLMEVLKKYHTHLSFTCVEMRDCEHPPEGRCSPQGLLQQVTSASMAAGIPLSGENALQRYDQQAFDRIAESAVGRSARAGRLQQLTFLRMGDLMFDNWGAFTQLLQRLHCNPQAQHLSNA
ncbi:hypothetical protein WJX79_002814 [Trebouxia sp. C0005]|nr:MAG: beta-amylase chloroplastic-like [Trebouxia sp. A1-2]KAA6426316.1 MAG: beta-amylase chloroplastic-like [Trebouxia sp. A1-2]